MEFNILYAVMTASEADDAFGKPKGTTKNKVHVKELVGRKSGGTWLVLRDDCEKLYRPALADQLTLDTISIDDADANTNANTDSNDVANAKTNTNTHSDTIGGVLTIESGRRGMIHWSTPEGLPVCYNGNQKGEVHADTLGLRDRAVVTCTHCKKKLEK